MLTKEQCKKALNDYELIKEFMEDLPSGLDGIELSCDSDELYDILNSLIEEHFEILEDRICPRTSHDSHAAFKIFKGDDQAVHWIVSKNDQPDQCRNQQDVQLPARERFFQFSTFCRFRR